MDWKILVLGLILLVSVVKATDINNCGANLNNSGDTYYLTADIIESPAPSICMDIQADNVTLDCQGHQIQGINASNTFGIYIDTGATNTMIQNCSVTSWGGGWNLGYGIYMASSGNTIIDTNTTTNKGAGIGLISSDNNILINIFSDLNWWEGINFISSNNNTLTEISTSGNHAHGIQLDSSDNNTFSFITMSAKNSYFGFAIMNSNNNSVKNAYLYHDTLYITGSNDSNFDNITAIGYTNGGSDGAIYLIDSNNNIYSNINSSSNHGSGVSLYSASTNNNFTNISVISNTNYGIYLQSGANNNIFNNVVAKSSTYGLYLQAGANNNIFNNTNTSSVNYGVYMASSGNIISNSIIKGSNSNGIYLNAAGLPDANIFYNNLFNNTNNIYFASSIYDNSWNTTNQSGIKIYSAGTNIGGNYWTNPSGTGYSDACMDASADGFCDTPYDVLNNVGCTAGVNCSNNTDYLPYAATPTYSVIWNSPQNAVWSNSQTIDHLYTINYTSDPFTECDLVTDISGTIIPVASNATPLQNNAQNTITYDYGADNNSFASYMTCIASDGYHSTSTVVMKIDTTPPTQVTGFTNTSTGGTWIYLSWSASIDTGSGVREYVIYRNDTNIFNTTSLDYNDTGLTPNTAYNYTAYSVDNADNPGLNATTLDVTTTYYLTDCANITSSGTYYLNVDIIDSPALICMDIQADNVTLDCHGHLIDSDGSGNFGVRGVGFNSITIKNCIITDWLSNGIYLDWSSDNIIHNNSISNVDDGIALFDGSNNLVYNNSAHNNTDDGIYLANISDSILHDNILNDNNFDGAEIASSSDNNQIYNIIANSNTENGIDLQGSYNNLTNISTTGNFRGLVIIGDYNNLTDIHSELDTVGIYMGDSSFNSLKNINVSNATGTGIYIELANYTTLTNSTATGNGDTGIVIEDSYFTNLTDVTANYNTPNGIVLQPSCCSVENNNLTNITANNNSANGIYLFISSNNILTDITANGNDIGVEFESNSNYNVLTNIITNSNNGGVGIDESSNNVISNLTTNSNLGGGIGFTGGAGSINNTVNDSIIQNNLQGVYIGVLAENNTLYNNLFNNTENIYFASSIYDNSWNTTNQSGIKIYSAGTNIGGNYWTNPSGTGYSDACMDASADGFCDTPYDVLNNVGCTAGVDCGNNTDYLPLSDNYSAGPTPPTPGTFGGITCTVMNLIVILSTLAIVIILALLAAGGQTNPALTMLVVVPMLLVLVVAIMNLVGSVC